MARRAQAFLILAFYLGPWLAWATLPRSIGFIYYYLPSATIASLAVVYVLTQGERAPPRWVLWAFVAAVLARLPCDAADFGRGAGNVDADLSAPDDLPELDLAIVMPGLARDCVLVLCTGTWMAGQARRMTLEKTQNQLNQATRRKVRRWR